MCLAALLFFEGDIFLWWKAEKVNFNTDPREWRGPTQTGFVCPSVYAFCLPVCICIYQYVNGCICVRVWRALYNWLWLCRGCHHSSSSKFPFKTSSFSCTLLLVGWRWGEGLVLSKVMNLYISGIYSALTTEWHMKCFFQWIISFSTDYTSSSSLHFTWVLSSVKLNQITRTLVTFTCFIF